MAYLGKSEVKRPWKPLKESRAHSLVQEGGRRGPVEVVGLLSVQPAAGPEVWNPGRCGSDFTSVADGPGGPAGGQALGLQVSSATHAPSSRRVLSVAGSLAPSF